MKGKKLSRKERIEKLEADANERRRVFRELCEHLERGYSIDCFAALSEMSIREYVKRFSEEFVEEEMIDAMRKGKEMWEGIGHRQANGQCLGNSRTWYYNMMNRYNWREKAQLETEHKGSVAVNIVSYASAKPSTHAPEKS